MEWNTWIQCAAPRWATPAASCSDDQMDFLICSMDFSLHFWQQLSRSGKKKNPVLPVKRHNQWIKTLQHKTALPVCLTSHEESIASWYWWNSAAHWLYMRGPVANWLLNAKINLLILGCLQDSLIFDDLGQTLNIYLFIFLRFITTDSNKSHPSLTMRWVHAVTHYRCPSNGSDWPEDSEKVTLLPGVWV